MGMTVDYPKKLVVDSIFKTSRSNKIAPRFVKTGGANGRRGLSGRLGTGAI